MTQLVAASLLALEATTFNVALFAHGVAVGYSPSRNKYIFHCEPYPYSFLSDQFFFA